MTESQAEERTRPFVALTALTLAMTIALLVWRTKLIAPVSVIAAIAVPWIAFSIFLRVKRDSWGREGKYLDLWSIPHFIGGMLLACFGIGFWLVLALTSWWECVEALCRVYEHKANRVIDVVLATSAWLLTQGAFGGSFPGW